MPNRPVILVVEDEPNLREMYDDIFTHAGFNVLTATCGDDAQDMLVALRPAVILTDIMMANGNGLKIRDVAQSLDVPVFFVSGYGDPYSMAIRETPLIPKPFDPDKLIATARQIMRTNHG